MFKLQAVLDGHMVAVTVLTTVLIYWSGPIYSRTVKASGFLTVWPSG